MSRLSGYYGLLGRGAADSLLRILDGIALVLLVGARHFGTIDIILVKIGNRHFWFVSSHLMRFCPAAVVLVTGGTGLREMDLSDVPSLAGTGGGLACKAGLGARGGCCGCCGCRDLARSSLILAFRKAVGIRLTRISTRDRSCCAWILY